jgi:hypothetical protein
LGAFHLAEPPCSDLSNRHGGKRRRPGATNVQPLHCAHAEYCELRMINRQGRQDRQENQ